ELTEILADIRAYFGVPKTTVEDNPARPQIAEPLSDFPDVSNDPIEIPDIILVLPLRNTVVFPGAILAFEVSHPRSVALLEAAISTRDTNIGVVLQRDPLVEDPDEHDLFQIGCVVRILKVVKVSQDMFAVTVQGIARFEIVRHVQREPFLKAHI